MTSLLTNLGDNLAQGSKKLKVNMAMVRRNVKNVQLNTNIMSAFSNTQMLESVHVVTRITKKKSDEDLKKWFANTYKFSNHDIKTFILLLRKGVYPYESMDQREKFNERQLTEKSNLIFIAT